MVGGNSQIWSKICKFAKLKGAEGSMHELGDLGHDTICQSSKKKMKGKESKMASKWT